MRQGNGCIMYEIFFVNLWVIILCPILRTLKLKKPKNLKRFLKKPRFFQPCQHPDIFRGNVSESVAV